MTRFSVFFSAFALLGLVACNGTGNVSNIAQNKPLPNPPEDFLKFYHQFHTDSLYQMAHIQWPLAGDIEVGEGSNRKVQVNAWSPEDWRMHQLVDFSARTDFKRDFEIVGDALIIEKIYAPSANMGQERRFFKEENGEWMLLHFSDMHDLGYAGLNRDTVKILPIGQQGAQQ